MMGDPRGNDTLMDFTFPSPASTGGLPLQGSAFAWPFLSLVGRESEEGNYTGDFTETSIKDVKVNYMNN